MSKTDRLLRSVAHRQRLNGVIVWFGRLAVSFGVLFVLLLVASRGLALIALDLDWITTLAVPALALLLALLAIRGRGAESAARLIDRTMRTKDLFLTSTRIEEAPGEYKPLVARAAEKAADSIRPSDVAPFQWRNPASWAAATVLLLVVCTWGIPQFDPFGIREQKARLADRKKDLEAEKKLAAARIEALQNKPLSAELSLEVEKSLKELMESFNKMKPLEMKANLDRLNEQGKNIGEQWRKGAEKGLQPKENAGSQKLGSINPKAEQWRKGLEKGDASELKKELSEAKELAKKIAAESDPGKKRELQEQLERKLQELSDFAQNQAGNQPLRDALQKAMEQLQANQMQGLSSEAMEALQSSLNLSELEMDQLGQLMRDQAAMEEMLKLIQMGKMANAGGKLDGSLTERLKNLEGYAELYEKICKECGECQGCDGTGKAEGKVGVCPFCKGTGMAAGPGMGGPGTGQGGKAPEDDSVKSAFKAEKSPAFVQAGKMLLEWKENEVPETGEGRAAYDEAVREVQQGVSEAIRAEEVPPGYHEAIKKYFDSVNNDGKK